jgi:hypothetical protein
MAFRTCSGCLLTDAIPSVIIEKSGLCSQCATPSSSPGRRPSETELASILKKHKGRHKYDCLVLCDGDVGSLAALYHMKIRYELNPLVLTVDAGFAEERALENVRRAVNKLGVDLFFYQTNQLKEPLRRVLRSGSKAVICYFHSLWRLLLAHQMAARTDAPLIVTGWMRDGPEAACGTALADLEAGFSAAETARFIRQELSDLPLLPALPESLSDLNKRARKLGKAVLISPLQSLPFTEEENKETVRSKLGWEPPGPGLGKLEAACCEKTFKDYGFTCRHFVLSEQVRAGALSRESALVELSAPDGSIRHALNRIGPEVTE